jgi:hypothetical protein
MRQLRDEIESPVSLDYFQKRTASGWKLKAIEWEKESEETASALPDGVPSPYGIALVPETARLQPKADEVEVLQTILELIVVEKGVAHIAAELNSRGYSMRSGKAWTSSAVFDLLPRLIETAPDILKSKDWQARRSRAVS